MKYTVGYDIGIASVGWSVIDTEENKLIDQGVRLFDTAMDASSRRTNRSARRSIRRKKWRKNQFKDALVDFEIVSRDEIEKKGYFSFNSTEKSKNENELDSSLIPLNYKTVYHLREKGLAEQLTEREWIIAIYNIVKTRGHFLQEHIDFSSDTMSEKEITTAILKSIDEYVNLVDKKDFEQTVLTKLIKGEFKSRELTTSIKNCTNVEVDENSEKKLEQILKLLGGWKANLSVLDQEFSSSSVSVTQLKSDIENQPEYIVDLVNLYDLIETYKVLSDFNYICEFNVSKIDAFASTYNNDAEFELAIKQIKEDMNPKSAEKRSKTVKNTKNNFPNGIYVKEARAILNQQQIHNPKITNEFIDVVCEIISARIPYYIGTMSSHENNNAWLSRTDTKTKYSYNYSKQYGIVDEEVTVENWKNSMISRCTYLPDEYALTKNSLIGEIFVILNDINIICSTNDISLSADDKCNILNHVFLNLDYDGKVKHLDVKNYLNIDYFGYKNRDTSNMLFKKQVSTYLSIVKILPDVKIDDIKSEIINIDNENTNLNKIENIIRILNIYDDTSNKQRAFEKLGYSTEISTQLAKIDVTGYLSISKKFICDTPVTKDGESIIERLLNSNDEQMTIISNAVDKNGVKINFSSNKYKKYFEEGNELGIDVLLKNGVPSFPISRPVVRALNQSLLVHNEIIKEFGHPKKVVIETARDLGDSKKGQESAKHYDQISKMIDDLEKQAGKNKAQADIDFSKDGKNKILELYQKYRVQIEMYLRQDGKDIITGKRIDINNLQNYDLDHILPRGYGDNSKNNQILIERSVNNLKQDRLPLEYIRLVPDKISEKAYIERVAKLFENKMISEEKYKLLMLEDQSSALGFIQKNLVDTRYIIREFGAILEAYSAYQNSVNSEIDTKYAFVQGTYNSVFRQAFKFIKSRELNSLHHAHDASLVIIIDKCLNSIFPGYSSGNMFSADKYKQFVAKHLDKKDVVNNSLEQYYNTLNVFRKMYYFTFNENYDDAASLINEIKNNYPRISYKVERKVTGQLFDATLYNPIGINNVTNGELKKIAKEEGINLEQEKETGKIKKILIEELGVDNLNRKIKNNSTNLLQLLNVSNDKRAMDSTYCCATDFYKVKEKKKNGTYKVTHYAIHIPLVIVDTNGNIDTEKYKLLVQKHYGASKLIDENGNIKEYLFRFRARKNDMIYDTFTNEIKLNNLGSIAQKKLEYKPIYFSNYSDEISKFYVIKNSFAKIYKEKKNLTNENLEELILLLEANEFINPDAKFNFNDVFSEILKSNSSNNEKIFKIINKINYSLINGAPTSLGQWISTANTSIFDKNNDDIQYVKVETSPLGIRVKNENGKIKIEGKHKKIKNNKEFSWNIFR